MAADFGFSNELEKEFSKRFGKQQGTANLATLKKAALDFEALRYKDALKTLEALMKEAPNVAEIQELYGLTHYHLQNYEVAIEHLEFFTKLTKGVEQHPVMADCYRAQNNYKKVGKLWEELQAANPPPDLLAEGRMVFVGSLVDQGNYKLGAQILRQALGAEGKDGEDKLPAEPTMWELRQVYALADIYDQSGDIPKSRALFSWVVENDFEMTTDAAERMSMM